MVDSPNPWNVLFHRTYTIKGEPPSFSTNQNTETIFFDNKIHSLRSVKNNVDYFNPDIASNPEYENENGIKPPEDYNTQDKT